MSVARCKGDIESATGRIRGQIDEAADVLATEVAHFGVYTGIVGPRLEISAAQLDSQAARTTQKPRGESLRHIVSERQLAKLHEGAILYILRHAVVVVALRTQQTS